MKFDIARQPLIPAFLTLAALAAAAMCDADVTAAGTAAAKAVGNGFVAVGSATATAVATAATDGLATALPGELLARFQSACPVWSRIIAALLILVTGIYAGRMTIRYNLYSVTTCLTVPLYGIIACGVAVGGDYLTAFTASALFMLSIKDFGRSLCNGYSFDTLFRASLYLGLLTLVSAAALPLLLLLPLALLLFRRTLREAVAALAGLLLPAFAYCYINWAVGGTFFAPLTALSHAFLTGAPLTVLAALPPFKLVLLGGIVLLVLLSLLFFLSDVYAAGTKSRFILIYNICAFALTILLLGSPAASPGSIALAAVPSAVLIPVLFVRINRYIALLLYLLLLAAAFSGTILQ